MEEKSTRNSSSSGSISDVLRDNSSQFSGSLPLSDLHTPPPLDLLTVFQAAPLAYTDSQNKINPLGLLDFASEKQILTESLRDAVGDRIEIVFAIATIDRLGDFLSRGEGEILHFSCHGHPQYLLVEDGWAHAQPLLVHDLKEWIQHGGKSLRFVFVSACHSRTIGDAFIEAGVPHVVCCQTDEQELHNVAAIEFEKAFYRNLACNRTLQEAFDLARYEAVVSPLLSAGQDPGAEIRKFVLLPEGADHGDSIFFSRTSPYSPKYRWKHPPFTAAIPPAPEGFIGRELEMFHIIDALKLSRLARVSGAPGIGKNAVVKACCHYMSDRSHILKLDDILWFPMEHELENRVYSSINCLFEFFQDDLCSLGSFGYGPEATYLSEVVSYFRHKRSLLVLDAKNILLENGINKLCVFVEQLLRGTFHVKVIVLHRPGDEITTEKMPCAETDIEIPALDFHATAMLFGWMCKHVKRRRYDPVGTPKEFAQILTSNGHRDPSDRLSKRVFSIIGEGVPERIQNIAKHMTGREYDKLIAISQTIVDSRAALEKKGRELAEEIARAVREKNFDHALELQSALDDIDLLREEYPGVKELERIAADIRGDLEFAIRSRDFSAAGDLQKELNRIERTIQIEKDAAIALGVEDLVDNLSEHVCPPASGPPHSGETRASLMKTIMKLELDLEKAVGFCDFQKAKEIDTEISRMKRTVESLPDVDKLTDEVFKLKTVMKQAIADRKFDECEIMHARLVRVEERLQAETRAAVELELDVRKIDPPGTYEHAEGEPSRQPPVPAARVADTNSSAHDLADRLEKQRESRPSSLVGRPTVPGAVAVAGLNREVSEEGISQASDDEISDLSDLRPPLQGSPQIHRMLSDDLPVAKLISDAWSRNSADGADERDDEESAQLMITEQDSLMDDILDTAAISRTAEPTTSHIEASAMTSSEAPNPMTRRQRAEREGAEIQIVPAIPVSTSLSSLSSLQSHERMDRNDDEQERINTMVQQALSDMTIQAASVRPVSQSERQDSAEVGGSGGRRKKLLRRLFRRK